MADRTTTWKQRNSLTRIAEANDAYVAAEKELKKAVRHARQDGCKYWLIAEQLKVSEGTIIQRFNRGYYDN